MNEEKAFNDKLSIGSTMVLEMHVKYQNYMLQHYRTLSFQKLKPEEECSIERSQEPKA